MNWSLLQIKQAESEEENTKRTLQLQQDLADLNQRRKILRDQKVTNNELSEEGESDIDINDEDQEGSEI